MAPTLEKERIAKVLAHAHHEAEPRISRIVRLVADAEQDGNEPIKLLEVNPDTPPSGIFPIVFGAAPPEIPFPSVIVEVTEHEFEEISSGVMPLPDGWKLGETLYPSGN